MNNIKLEIPNFEDIENIKTGDMPGDKVSIDQSHIDKSIRIMGKLESSLKKQKASKIVVSVYGGSGVGKSETASLLAKILNHNGIGTYILSGDNYPHRIPLYNDAERIRIFRESAVKGLVKSGQYTKEIHDTIFKLMENENDCNKELINKYSFLEAYIESGIKGLSNYLGTSNEIDFDEINHIVEKFKKEDKNILLKRMGRTDTELWYDEVDFANVEVLIIEWTHGNNHELVGIDIPILLKSTPEETLAHRASRNRDGGVDSPFVKIVLDIEQGKIVSQTETAEIIMAKNGDLITYEEFRKLME